MWRELKKSHGMYVERRKMVQMSQFAGQKMRHTWEKIFANHISNKDIISQI